MKLVKCKNDYGMDRTVEDKEISVEEFENIINKKVLENEGWWIDRRINEHLVLIDVGLEDDFIGATGTKEEIDEYCGRIYKNNILKIKKVKKELKNGK